MQRKVVYTFKDPKVQMLSSTQFLEQGRALIAPPYRNIRKAYAYDVHGSVVDPTSPSACSFCTLGALLNVTNTRVEYRWGSTPFQSTVQFLHNAAEQLYGTAVDAVMVNDHKSHDEIMKMWDLAIEMSKGTAQ